MPAEFPEISIIIPAYNAEKYLAGCIDSITCQTFADWELIIVDDGSRDKTGQIADGFASADRRIRVIHNENGGVSAARNNGIETARGRYLSFMDSDDRLENNYLEELHTHAEESNADITQCSFCFVDEDGNRNPYPGITDAVYKGHEEIMHAYFRGQQGDIYVSVWAKLFKRELFSEMRFDTGLRVYEDAYYVYHCCRKARKVCSLKTPLYLYIQHKDSVTHSRLTGIWTDYFAMYDLQKSECRDDRAIFRNINRREAETGLWLMRIMICEGKEQFVWDLRKRLLGITWSVLWSSVPFRMKLKLIGVALMPHIYFAMLRKRIITDNEKV